MEYEGQKNDEKKVPQKLSCEVSIMPGGSVKIDFILI